MNDVRGGARGPGRGAPGRDAASAGGRLRAALAAAGLLFIVGGVIVALPPAGIEALESPRGGSLRIEDREGRLLRDVPTGGDHSRRVTLEELPPWVPDALLAAEDRRFRWHPGVDPIAILRAARANRDAGRVVSGASTVTMQLARLLSGRPAARTPAAKSREALDALRLEARLSKARILEEYLNRVAFGRGAIGIESAARQWFGRPARTLSPAEAAWLAVLPRAPSLYGRPDFRDRLEARRIGILESMASGGTLDPDLAARAIAAPPRPIDRTPGAFHAPHWTDWLLDLEAPALRNRGGTLRTTLDLALQGELEGRLRTRMTRLAERGATHAAVVVQRTDTGDIHALLGSADFFDSAGGQVNGALAPRQAGSTLKPFLYALAFESGLTPASIILDEPTAFAADGGPFVPRNYGGEHFGPVPLRTALASSLNMPAVRLLERLGTERLQSRLAVMGLGPDRFAAAGLGLTLGVAEVRLVDLVNAYAALGRGGLAQPFRLIREARDARGRPLPAPPLPPAVRVFDPLAAWWVADVLRDDTARRLTFGAGGVLDMPWPVAVKTGTSSDWRDNWAVGTTAEWTIGVWVGDFSGRPMERVSGVYGAAPLLREFFGVLAAREPLTAPIPPPGLIAASFCPTTGDPAGHACPPGPTEMWPARRPLRSTCGRHAAPSAALSEDVPALRIDCPTEGDTYFIDPALPAGTELLSFRAVAAPGATLDWWLNGRLLAQTGAPGSVGWALLPGRHRLEVRSGGTAIVRNFQVVGPDVVPARASAREALRQNSSSSAGR